MLFSLSFCFVPLFSTLNSKLSKVIHKHCERYVIREDHLTNSALASLVMRHVRIDDGEQEACLTRMLVAHDEARIREAVLNDRLCVRNGSFQELLECCIFGLVLVAFLAPVSNICRSLRNQKTNTSSSYFLQRTLQPGRRCRAIGCDREQRSRRRGEPAREDPKCCTRRVWVGSWWDYLLRSHGKAPS